MNSFLEFFKGRPVSMLLAALPILAGATSIYKNLGFLWTTVIILFTLLILLVFYSIFLNKKIIALEKISLKTTIVDVFKKSRPEAIKIGEWINSTLFASNAIEVLSDANKALYLLRYVKNVSISTNNIEVTQIFDGKNSSLTSVDQISLASVSGSSQQIKNIKLDLHQELNGKKLPIVKTIEYINERLNKIKIQFITPITLRKPFKISVKEIKKNTMWEDMDAVLYTPISYFTKGIELFTSKIVFDTAVRSVGAYFYDLENNELHACKEQPIETSSNEFNLEIENPKPHFLYFIIYYR